MISSLKNRIYKTLKWSERYTKTDMLYLARGSFWLTTSQIVSIIAGLSLSVAFANLVPKEVFGNYKFVLSIAGVLGAFTLTGMGTAITRAAAKGYEGALLSGFKTQMKWSIGIVLSSIVVSIYYFINENTTLAIASLFIATFTPLQLASNLFGSYLNGKKNFRSIAFSNLFRNTLPVIFLIPILFFSNNILLIVFTYFLATTLPTYYFYLQTIKRYPQTSKGFDTSHDMVSYSKHLSLMNVLSTFAAHLDKILIFHYFGAVQLAIYAFAVALPTQMQTSTTILNSLILPKYSSKNINEIKQSLKRKILLVTLAGAFVSLLYFISAPFIYKLIFPNYLDSIIYSQVYGFILLFTGLSVLNQILLSQGKKQELYIVRISSALIRVVLLIVLLPLYGVWGAIFAILATRGINMLAHAVLILRLKN